MSAVSTGVTTNEKGEFELEIPLRYKNDSLIVSYLGYYSKKIPLNSLDYSVNNIISLHPNVQLLDEIILNYNKINYKDDVELLSLKKKKLASFSIPFGYEKVTYIENKNFALGKVSSVILHLKKVDDFLDYNIEKTYYRLKFYDVSSSEFKPNQVLCTKEILIKPNNISQELLIDVDSYNIQFPLNGFFVGVEVVSPNGRSRVYDKVYKSPALVITHTKQPLSFMRFPGRKWFIQNGKSWIRKKRYQTLLVDVNVRFAK